MGDDREARFAGAFECGAKQRDIFRVDGGQTAYAGHTYLRFQVDEAVRRPVEEERPKHTIGARK